jgi:chromosome segregation ATPase
VLESSAHEIILETNRKLSAASHTIADLTNKFVHRSENEVVRHSLPVTAARLRSCNAQNDAHTHTLQGYEATIAELTAQRAAAERQCSLRHHEVESLRSRVEQLEADLRARPSRDEHQSLVRKLRVFEAESGGLDDDGVDHHSEDAWFQRRCESLKAEVRRERALREDAETRCEQLTSAVKSLEKVRNTRAAAEAFAFTYRRRHGQQLLDEKASLVAALESDLLAAHQVARRGHD